MATGDEPEVKDVDTVHVAPAEGGETVEAEGTAAEPESSQAENAEGEPQGDEPEKKPDALVRSQPQPEVPAETQPTGNDELAIVPGETPRERALRIELTDQRRENRRLRGDDLGIGKQPEPAPKQELSPEKKAVLGKYTTEELSALREVVDVLAEDMGLVRKDQLNQTTYTDRANDELNTFLDKHTEYLPENDKDGTLWSAFKKEYSLYKQPSNPKDFQKIFDRVHRDVFGIKPGGSLPKINAQREKLNVASHAGTSPTAPTRTQPAQGAPGLRIDMLKGFSEEDLSEMGSE